ncbi:MAG TPA: ABC transporter ATP-binding protein [Firmicutes bacterium]|nr:ABC transporter ATP-binding protein [Bacillota bacterium]
MNPLSGKIAPVVMINKEEAMNESFLVIQLSKLYPEFKLQVELEIEKGEFFSLIGPSGCGKTTLLRLIAGLESPDRGFLYLNGRNLTAVPPANRRVGLVFQDYALFPHLTVAENVEYGLQVQQIPSSKRKERVRELLSVFQLEALASRQTQQLSGGERQRVAFARALAPEPLLLLMDEPFSALDYGLRQKLQKDLGRIQKHLGFTVIFVTHQQEEALSLSDRLAVMQEGRVLQFGTPQEIYEKPFNSFVAEFLGDANLIPCHLEQLGEKTCIDINEHDRLELPALPGYPSGNYFLMVRPEDFQLKGLKGPALKARITVLEYLGFSYRMEASIGQYRIKVLIGKEIADLKVGLEIAVRINPQKIRFIPQE